MLERRARRHRCTSDGADRSPILGQLTVIQLLIAVAIETRGTKNIATHATGSAKALNCLCSQEQASKRTHVFDDPKRYVPAIFETSMTQSRRVRK